MARLTIEENQEVLNAVKRGVAELQLLHDQISDLESSTTRVDFKKSMLTIENYNHKLELFRESVGELFDGFDLVDSADSALDEGEDEDGGEEEDEDVD